MAAASGDAASGSAAHSAVQGESGLVPSWYTPNRTRPVTALSSSPPKTKPRARLG